MAFQRKRPAAKGVKAPFRGFVQPALATSIEKAPSGGPGGTAMMLESKFEAEIIENDVVVVHLSEGHIFYFPILANDS